MIFSKQVNRYYLKYGLLLIFGMLVLVMVDYVQLIVPEKYRMLINGIEYGSVVVKDETLAFDSAFLLDEICMPMLFIVLTLVVGRFSWRIAFFGTSIRVEADLRARLFDHCKDLSRQFYHTNKVGNLMSLYTNDIETIQECFGMGVLMATDAVFLGTLAVIKMARMNPLLTVFCMIPMGFLLAGSIILGKYMEKKWALRQEAFSELSDFSQESFSGISVIKAFVKEGKELWAFKKINKKNENANVTYVRYSMTFRIFVTLFVESVTCIILGYGGYLVYKGSFNSGQLMEFIAYFNAIIWPVMAVSELIEMTSKGKASLGRIEALLNEKADVGDLPGSTDIGTLSGKIEIRDLSFTYEGREKPILRNVTLTVECGETVGIIGGTGSGKSSIASMLERCYNVPDGTILFDGKDINSATVRSLRRNIAYVPQEVFLFSESIRENVRFCRENVSDEDIENACRAACLHESIMGFREGYDTVLGERGVTLSGGQRQRLSIARALVGDAPILILDDSVSAVDVSTEQEILANLKENRKGRTTLIIGHRISTIENADKIAFMEDGRILAVGNHKELMEICPQYRKEVLLQRLEDSKKEAK